MNKYRLFVRKATDFSTSPATQYEWEELDLGDEKPAMTYQINNLNELKDRSATYSQKIKLPRSNHNMMVLDFVDNFDVNAIAAYNPKEALLTCEGVPISPVGALLYIDTINQNVECQIVSAIFDLFRRMETSDQTLYYSDWHYYVWDRQGYKYWNTTDEDDAWHVKMKFPILNTNKRLDTGSWKFMNRLPVTYMHNLIPAVQFYSLVKGVLGYHNFKLITDLENNAEVKKDYLTVGEMAAPGVNYTRANFYYGGNIPRSTSTSGTTSIPINLQADYVDSVVASTYAPRFIAPSPGQYRLRIFIYSPQPITTTSRSVVWTARRTIGPTGGGTGVAIYGGDPIVTTYQNGRYEYEFEQDIMLGQGDSLTLTMESTNQNITQTPAYFYTYISAPADAPTVGQAGYIANDLGFKSNLELFKTFIQTYGLLVDIKRYADRVNDPDVWFGSYEGELRCYTFNEILRRRDAGQYVDWSDKLVIDKANQFTFKAGEYAQENHIDLTANEDDVVSGRVTIGVNNKTLDPDKNLFTLPIQAGADVSYGALNMASIPITEAQEEQVTDTRMAINRIYKGAPPHLITISDTSTTVGVIQSKEYGSGQQGDPDPTIEGWEGRHRPMSYFQSWYAVLQNMLHDAKSIKVKFNLDVVDIEQLDFFDPVWIDYYGAFFYISKINNFVAGQPTTCDLIRL